MSNSSLISVIYRGLQSMEDRDRPISKITIHDTGCDMSLTDLKGVMQSCEASYNYAIDKYGRIALFIPEGSRSFSSSNVDNDMAAINIIVCNSNIRYEISDEAYQSLLELCIDICERNNISRLTYTGNVSDTLTTHDLFYDVDCPRRPLRSKLPDLVKYVNSRI